LGVGILKCHGAVKRVCGSRSNLIFSHR